MENKAKATMMDSFKTIKENFSAFVKTNNLKELQVPVTKFFTTVQKDLNGLMDNDVATFLKKFKDEKKQIENTLESFVNKEVMRAKNFVEGQKKELSTIQKKVETILGKPVATKAAPKATAKKATVKKATAKKANRKTTSKKATV